MTPTTERQIAYRCDTCGKEEDRPDVQADWVGFPDSWYIVQTRLRREGTLADTYTFCSRECMTAYANDGTEASQ